MNLLSDVRQFLEIFRAHLPDTVIAEYEHGTQRPGTLTIDGAPRAGTLCFLEQEFVDRIFRRSEDFEYISPDQTFFKGQPTFNQHIRLLNGTLLQLTKKYDVAKIRHCRPSGMLRQLLQLIAPSSHWDTIILMLLVL